MGIKDPRSVYGIHSVTPYSRIDGSFYGIIKVLDSSSLSLSAEQNDLTGGSNKYPWASEDGAVSAEMSLKVGQMEDFMFELFLGKAPTKTTSEASGAVSALVNKKGTSVFNAITGVTGVAVIPTTGAANLKFGRYVLKALSATTVKVLVSTDIDFARGIDAEYDNDDLSVTGNAQTIVAADSTALAALGLQLTGGSAIAMVPGDTATFEVRPVNSSSSVVRVGAAADVFPEFGAIIMAQARATGELFEIDAFRCKASGMPIGFDTFAWSKPEIKAKLLYDSKKNGVFDARHVMI